MADAALIPLGGVHDISTPQIGDAFASAKAYARAETAEATRRAYAIAWRAFETWCAGQSAMTLPAAPGVVAAYLAAMADAGRKASTIKQHAGAIAFVHHKAGHPSPTSAPEVKSVMRGIRRTIGTAVVQKSPATAKALRAMLKLIPDTLAGRRDRALLLLGFAGALRRSELVALDVGDIERTADGVFLHVRHSKTDQEGAGHIVAVPMGTRLRPVDALDAWLQAAAIGDGPVFRSIGKGGRVGERLTDRSVAEIVKRWAAHGLMNPKLFSGHSLRSGFVSEALDQGADLFRIMDTTRHKTVQTLRAYDRRAKAFKDHAGDGFL